MLIGGVAAKLAFFNRVHYDPAQNQPLFPSYPIKLIPAKALQFPSRSKRQITLGVVLLTFITSAVASLITGATSALTLQKEFNAKLTHLETEINKRFAQEDANLQLLATRINELEGQNLIQSEAISRAMQDIFKDISLEEQTDRFLQSEISENQRQIMLNVKQVINSTAVETQMSLAQLEINNLVLNYLRNQTALKIFNPNMTYLTTFKEGIVFLKEYSHYKYKSPSQEIPLELQAIDRNETLNLHLAQHQVKVLESSSSLKYVNVSSLRVEPINLNFTQSNISPQDFADSLLNGLNIVPHSLSDMAQKTMDDVTSVVGNGLKNLFVFLSPILVPLIVFIVLGIILLCCCKYNPKLKQRRKKQKELKQSRRKLTRDLIETSV